MSLILILVLVVLLVGALPVWPHSHAWGAAPSSILTVLVVILLILFLSGRL